MRVKAKRLKAMLGGVEHPKKPGCPSMGGTPFPGPGWLVPTGPSPPPTCSHPAHGHRCPLPGPRRSLSPRPRWGHPPALTQSQNIGRGSKNNPSPAQSNCCSSGRGDSSRREHPKIAAQPLLPPPPSLGEHPRWGPQIQLGSVLGNRGTHTGDAGPHPATPPRHFPFLHFPKRSWAPGWAHGREANTPKTPLPHTRGPPLV